ncbi:MAG: XdhC family protein [Caulobacteraceae bacterium]|nr:XdhC family protein [Caulobacter sp.]
MDAQLPDWPVFGLADDIRPALAQAFAAGRPAALATLHRAIGGAPRPPGAQMLVSDAALSGFLSGGCVEGDILLHARACLEDGAPRRLVYGEGGPPDIRLLCGARIEILLERVTPDDDVARALLDFAERRVPALWATDGVRRTCMPADRAPPPGEWTLVRRYDPRMRLVVVGGDPTALAIASLAVAMGAETHLVRPRGPEAPPPVAGLVYHRGPPERALDPVPLDAWTHVAVATHDLETDEAALIAALASPAAYVGVLGARRRIPERRARLLARGVTLEQLARLHAPIGLDLGGKAPFEIAVAVMAEITAALHAEAPPLLQTTAALAA